MVIVIFSNRILLLQKVAENIFIKFSATKSILKEFSFLQRK